jgi:hypothetical protein
LPKEAKPSADSGYQGLDNFSSPLPSNQNTIFKKSTNTPLTKEERDDNAGLSRIPREDRTHLRGRSTSSTSSLK